MKKLVLRFAAVWICLSVLPAFAPAQGTGGAGVYNDNCARCHSPRAPAEFSDSAWNIIIHHMHTRGYLTEKERTMVLRFLQQNNRSALVALEAPKPAMPQSDDPEVLITQFGCKGCHVISGAGGTIGPALDTVFQRRDSAFIIAKLDNPKVDNPRSVMPFFNLSDTQKKALVDYLKSIQK